MLNKVMEQGHCVSENDEVSSVSSTLVGEIFRAVLHDASGDVVVHCLIDSEASLLQPAKKVADVIVEHAQQRAI